MLEKEKMVAIYRRMVEIRTFELTCANLFQQGKIKGSVHPYTGQEAVAVGACFALRKDDYITGTHRTHGHNLAKGADMRKVLAEIMGKQTGCNGGRSGSMHVTAVEVGNLLSTAIVGEGIPIAVGSALSAKMKKTGKVTLCFFGEGATNTGSFHESLNLASIWKLPVVFLCENNIYAVSTPAWYSISVKNVSQRANAYNIPGFTVDGNDVLAVYAVVSKAVARTRREQGPSLIECKTYRWEGHYVGEPRVYRTKKEEGEWREKDPIKRFESKLIEMGILTKEETKSIKEESRKKVEDAVDFASKSPDPSPDRALSHVYAEQEVKQCQR